MARIANYCRSGSKLHQHLQDYKILTYYSYVFIGCSLLGLVNDILIIALTMAISGFIFGFGPWVLNLRFGLRRLVSSYDFGAPKVVTCLADCWLLSCPFSAGSHGLQLWPLFRSGLTFCYISGLLYDTYHAVSTFYSIHPSSLFQEVCEI